LKHDLASGPTAGEGQQPLESDQRAGRIDLYEIGTPSPSSLMLKVKNRGDATAKSSHGRTGDEG